MREKKGNLAGVPRAVALALVLTALNAHAAVYSGGMGTAADPWQIGTVGDWATLCATPDDWDNHFVVIADLDFAGASLPPVAPDTDDAIDFQGVAFTGIIDGGGHVMRNALVNLPENEYVGLVGFLGAGGEVFDLGVEGIAVTGENYVGGLVGYVHEGAITSCYTTGDVSASDVFGGQVGGLVGENAWGTILSCYATGNIEGYDQVGGLVGKNHRGLVESCRATGEVAGEDDIGGLAGGNGGTLTSCCATGTVYGEDDIGGLAGYNEGTVVSCYARGNANGEESDIGGLVGENNGGTILSCYSTGKASSGESDPDVGGLVGANVPGSVTTSYWDRETSGLIISAGGAARTTDDMTYPYGADTYTGWDNVYIWAADTEYTINDGYPYLRNCAGPVVEEEESCGCCSTSAKHLPVRHLLERTLGDWLLAALGVSVLGLFSRLRG